MTIIILQVWCKEVREDSILVAVNKSGGGNHYTFDEIAEIMGGDKDWLYHLYLNDTDLFLQDFKKK